MMSGTRTALLNKRLLWSIIRGTPSPTKTSWNIQFRTFSKSISAKAPSSTSSGFSVSFGDPETDAAIAQIKKPPSPKKTTKSKPSKLLPASSSGVKAQRANLNPSVKSGNSHDQSGAELQQGELAKLLNLNLEGDKALYAQPTQDGTQSETFPAAMVELSSDLDSLGDESIPFEDDTPRYTNTFSKNDTRETGPLKIRKVQITNQPKKEFWQIQKEALTRKFGDEGWNPRKKVSPDAMEGIRALHAQDPDKFSTPVLAQQFEISAEAVRRILRSKWRPSTDKMDERRERWAKRHDRLWDQKVELGLRPKRRKPRETEGPEEFEEALKAREILEESRNA